MDMPNIQHRRIFDDKRRGGRSNAPDPFRTGPLYAPLQDMAAASRMSCVGAATRRHPLLSPMSCNGAKSGPATTTVGM